MFQFPSRGLAQGNLVNLYDWTNETVVEAGDNPDNFVSIGSSTSADFFGGLIDNSNVLTEVEPTITGTLDTVSGATYDISFTVEDDTLYGPSSATEYFGDTSTSISLPPEQQNFPGDNVPVPVNVDFTAVATCATTTMSFGFGLDPTAGDDLLYNLSVTEVPETSSPGLFLFGVCILLLARQLRAATKKRKLAFESMA